MPTFGFETARHVGTEIVRNLMEDARSTRRWYVVVAMGRKAGHLALGIGKAAGATLTVIAEEFASETVSFAHICDIVEGAIEDGKERPRKGDADRRAGLEVPRSADDLPRIALTHVDLTDAQAVSVRMRVGREHAAHEEAAEVAVQVGDADVGHLLDLGRRGEEPLGDLVRRRVHGDVLAEPGKRHVHQNCSRNRGSLRQSSRRSGMPCRRTAIRSSPQPKAKPVQRSGS